MYLDTAMNMNEILDKVLGDDSKSDIDWGYENNLYNEVSDWDNKVEPTATAEIITVTVVDEQEFNTDEMIFSENHELVTVVPTLLGKPAIPYDCCWIFYWQCS